MRYMEYFCKETKLKVPIVTALAMLSVAIVASSINNHARAQTGSMNELMNMTLIATGTATGHMKPDKVTVILGVETTNSTAQSALLLNSNLMNKVLDALKSQGVKDNETSTSTFSVTPNYNYSSATSQGRLTGFTVSNSIQIESSNVDNVSKWIDTGVSAGANNVNNIYFSLSDKKLEEIKNALLKDAIANAKLKADTAAKAAGLKVLGIKSIVVGEAGIPPIVPVNRALAFDGGSPSPTPIISGQQEVSMTVNVVYLLG
jgi:uncharacterized protein YggE